MNSNKSRNQMVAAKSKETGSNKRRRRLGQQLAISTLAISLLSGGMATSSFAASFDDLNGVPGKDKITSLATQKVINGMSDTHFAPGKSLTQAQALHMMVKAFKLDTVQSPAPDPLAGDENKAQQPTIPQFSKVKPSAWYADTFTTAAQAGLDIPATVNPDAPITREQYVDYVMSAMQLTGKMPVFRIIPPDINDQSAMDISHVGSVQLAIVLKIVSMDANGNFNPKQNITRADAAIMLYDGLNYLNRFTPAAAPSADHSQVASDLPLIEDAPAGESYAMTNNGEIILMQDVNQALAQHANDKDALYFVAIDLTQNGKPLEPDSTQAAAELKRMQQLGYDVAMNTGWTYKGQLEKSEFRYVSGYFTADQLKSFKPDANYGYAIHFSYNGDGSPAKAKNDAINR
ncbi:S-layer homology domain-containing protein [Paenibacillus wenxiniae]|uniref:S-layer homology domain-containing protein n=1 Tax=Paenibacillus wenxiniae TaxID=1636843 RepID=A0ABW4RM87_9BACL